MENKLNDFQFSAIDSLGEHLPQSKFYQGGVSTSEQQSQLGDLE